MNSIRVSLMNEDLLKQEAIEWYSKKEPYRQLSEEEIIEMYKSILEYASGDPLLEEFYRANQVNL